MKILNPIAKIKDKENTLGLNIEKKSTTKKSMTNQSKKRLSENGKKIMAKAKKIRMANLKMKWQDCVKKAGKELKI